MSKAFDAIVLTCEHGGNDVPEAYAKLFRGKGKVLATHRGWDVGALAVARGLAKRVQAPLHFATTTRLLVDVNRSLHVKGAWSEWTRGLDAATRNEIAARYHAPYREAVEERLTKLIDSGKRVLHLSIHSFTPELNGDVRNAEVGILYDPRRAFEANLARRLGDAVAAQNPEIRVRRNYPYVGYSDGFTTYLRKQFPASCYAGIEIESKQDEIETEAGQRRYVECYEQAIRSL